MSLWGSDGTAEAHSQGRSNRREDGAPSKVRKDYKWGSDMIELYRAQVSYSVENGLVGSLQATPIKGLMTNVLGSAGHVVSVTTAGFCHSSAKAATGHTETSLAETAGRLGLAHYLLNPGLEG